MVVCAWACVLKEEGGRGGSGDWVSFFFSNVFFREKETLLFCFEMSNTYIFVHRLYSTKKVFMTLY